ncbi:30S ribosomal protein S16 [Patescibacteria group bacterium]|nr:30S ribosomal protein S16 [Patescibacteria group bacterium]
MLVIRFTRIGKKNQPTFRIVVVDKRRSASAGKCTEILGSKSPLTKKVVLNAERIKYWISKGAQPSDSVKNLLIKEKVIEGTKVAIKMKKKEVVSPAAPAVEKPVVDVDKQPEGSKV